MDINLGVKKLNIYKRMEECLKDFHCFIPFYLQYRYN